MMTFIATIVGLVFATIATAYLVDRLLGEPRLWRSPRLFRPKPPAIRPLAVYTNAGAAELMPGDTLYGEAPGVRVTILRNYDGSISAGITTIPTHPKERRQARASSANIFS